jgi:hypothetical protein
MDSAVREISSSARAHDFVETTASPPNAIATPTIACRRVGPWVGARLFVLLTLVLQILDFSVARMRTPIDNVFNKNIPADAQEGKVRSTKLARK